MIPVRGRKLFLTCDDASDPNLSVLAPPHPVDIVAPNLDEDHRVRSTRGCHPFHADFLENFREDGVDAWRTRHHARSRGGDVRETTRPRRAAGRGLLPA